jgi:magnesium-transporting ATPase (P-type)
MACEIAGGFICKSNSLLVVGVLKLQDIGTFLVSILYLEIKRNTKHKHKSNSIDSRIVKDALFWLGTQFVVICLLIWRGVSMISGEKMIVLNTNIMLIFACISLASAYFTMYVHGYFKNQTYCVNDRKTTALKPNKTRFEPFRETITSKDLLDT